MAFRRSTVRSRSAPPKIAINDLTPIREGRRLCCIRSSVQRLLSLALTAGFVNRVETFELPRTALGVFRMFVIRKPPLLAEWATMAILTEPALPVSGVSPRDEHSLVLRCSRNVFAHRGSFVEVEFFNSPCLGPFRMSDDVIV